MMEAADVRTFGELVTWLTETFHHGSYYAFAKSVSVNPALVYAWRDGLVKSPRNHRVLELARRYNLSLEWLMGLITDGQDEQGRPAKRRPVSPLGPAGGKRAKKPSSYGSHLKHSSKLACFALLSLGWIFFSISGPTQTPYGPFTDIGYCQAMRTWVESLGKITTPCVETR